ncbi:MAG: thiamine phosphate synthase [Homoserinimonas sp.]|nr:thiamine phosphate synthase [Homoserinimonas sp.]
MTRFRCGGRLSSPLSPGGTPAEPPTIIKDVTHPIPAFAGLTAGTTRGTRTEKLADARLYLCTDARGRQGDLADFLHAAYAGGVDIIQLRDKTLDTDAEVAALHLLAGVAGEHGKLFAVNDRADIAALVNADIFHIGQRDLSPAQARCLLGTEILIGRSTHDLNQARTAAEDPDVDYFCTGPLWETPTKPGRPATGLRLVRDVAELRAGSPTAASIPWFAIGGINVSRLPEVLEAGADRVVVVRAIAETTDPYTAARQLRQLLPV